LMGVETQNALLSDRVLQLNLTNEGGIDGTFRLLKNITGLWLVQQCKRVFEARGRNLDYPDMPAAIQSLCRETNQPAPQTEGALVRCALESLAARYCRVLEGLEQVTGTDIDVIHVVGGGSRNQLLNQLTANKCRRRVVAGPTETTVLGNLLSQVRAAGELKSLSEMREIVRSASELQVFEPHAG
jgi:rhamnulokinase